jgi:hypothetical protein
MMIEIFQFYIYAKWIDYHQTDLQIQLFFIKLLNQNLNGKGVLSLKGEVFDLIL